MKNEIKAPKNVRHIKVLVFLLIITTLVIFTVLQFFPIKDVHDRSSILLIEDVLKAEKQPSKTGNSIFFHKSGFQLPMRELLFTFFGFVQPEILKIYSADLLPQEACSIESAALHNPDSEIFVLFMDQSNWIHSKQGSLWKTLLAAYPNINVRTVNFRNYLKNTPVMDWLDKGFLKFNFVEKEAMNILRFLSALHYGGTFVDFDAIVLRNLDELGSNYIVANEELNEMTLSILNLKLVDVARELTIKYLSNYLYFFNGADNPKNYKEKTLYQAAKSILCNKTIVEMVLERNCSSVVKIYGNSQFHDVSLPPQMANETRSSLSELFRNSQQWFAAYSRGRFWNEKKYESIAIGPKRFLTMKHCPKVYKKAIGIEL